MIWIAHHEDKKIWPKGLKKLTKARNVRDALHVCAVGYC